jgi:hypothetical protein
LLNIIDLFEASSSLSTTTTTTIRCSIPIRNDGVIFVSDGAKGIAREASLQLASYGFHVLVGVKTNAEVRSFAYESRKGLEPLIFDIQDPTTFVPLIYKLRKIETSLDRKFVGVVINIAGYLLFFIFSLNYLSNIDSLLLLFFYYLFFI